MTGTIINSGAIVAGSLVGIAAGKKLPERVKGIMIDALGLSVLVIGLQMALSETSLISPVACVLAGAVTGEALRIESWIGKLGNWIKKWCKSESSTFVKGFLSASILYITGAMVIIGSIQDGVAGDPTTLCIKALLDGVASIAFASTFGVGVLFSALPVFIVQGSITLLSSKLLCLQNPHVLNMVMATGGILIVGIGINILGIRDIRIGNFVPSILFAIIWAISFS